MAKDGRIYFCELAEVSLPVTAADFDPEAAVVLY